MLVYLRGRICSEKSTCCHTEIEVADQTFYFTQSRCTDIGPTSPTTDPGAWQGSHWSAMSQPGKSPWRKRESNPGSSALQADATRLWAELRIANNEICRVCLFVGWLLNVPESVSQGRICSDNFTCCHTQMQVADQTFHLTQSQYTDTGPTSPCSDPITPVASVTGMTRPRKNPGTSVIRTRDLPLSRWSPYH